MAPRFNVIQADYIYDLEWMEKADRLFISVLLDQQMLGKFKYGETNAHVLLVAQASVNKELDKSFDYEYIQRRLEILDKRYRTFYWIKRKHGVRFNEATNTVTAPDFVWDEIFKKDEFGLAYQEVGDPDWAELNLLFGAMHAKPIPDDVEVIDISSDGETEDIGNLQGLPTTESGWNRANRTFSWPSQDESFWNYLANFGPQMSSGSESSVNQPVRLTDNKDYPSPSFYRRPKIGSRPPRPRLPSPAASVETNDSASKPS